MSNINKSLVIKPKQTSIDRFKDNQTNPEIQGSIADSLNVLEENGFGIAITNSELVISNSEERQKLITQLQNRHSFLSYDCEEETESYVSLLSKSIFLETMEDLENKSLKQIVEELNLDLTQPIVYVSLLCAIEKFSKDNVTSLTQNTSDSSRLKKVSKSAREILSEKLFEDDSTEKYDEYINQIMDLWFAQDGDEVLAKGLIKELMLERSGNSNIRKSFFNAQQNNLKSGSSYKAVGKRVNFRDNNIEAGFLESEIDETLLDSYLQRYKLEEDFSDSSEDLMGTAYHKVISTILEDEILKPIILDEDNYLIEDRYEERLSVLTYLLKVKIGYRENQSGESHSIDEIENFEDYIKPVSDRYSHLNADLSKLINQKSQLERGSEVTLNKAGAFKQIEADTELIVANTYSEVKSTIQPFSYDDSDFMEEAQEKIEIEELIDQLESLIRQNPSSLNPIIERLSEKYDENVTNHIKEEIEARLQKPKFNL